MAEVQIDRLGRRAGGRRGEGDDAAVDRVVALSAVTDGQGDGEGRADARPAGSRGDGKVNPWLSKAPMSTVPLTARVAALVGGDAGRDEGVVPASMAGLPGNRGMVWVGPP